MANPMSKFRKACTRREFTTPGGDPTIVVEWTIPGTDWEGNVLAGPEHAKMRTREFQGIVNGWLEFPGGLVQVPVNVAELTHNQLEELYHEELEASEPEPRMWS